MSTNPAILPWILKKIQKRTCTFCNQLLPSLTGTQWETQYITSKLESRCCSAFIGLFRTQNTVSLPNLLMVNCNGKLLLMVIQQQLIVVLGKVQAKHLRVHGGNKKFQTSILKFQTMEPDGPHPGKRKFDYQ
jgi:hypothetical protein